MTKSQGLMLYIAKNCGNSMWIHNASRDGNVDDDTINAINYYGISANRDSLKKMLKNLENMGYACASTIHNGDKVWSLTIDGRNEIISLLSSDEDNEIEDTSDANDQVEKLSLECGKLAKKVMDLEAELEKKNNEIEAFRNENLALKSITNQTTSSYIEEAQKWASIANTIANGLNESASLKEENDALKRKVAAIQATLTETYAKLCEKTTAFNKMETELSRVLASFNEMAKWIEDIKAGGH